MFNFPDVTGSVGAKAAPPPETGPVKSNRTAALDPPLTPGGTPVTSERPVSPAERAILERLAERRGELDARARDIEMRESLLKAAEKRLEGRIAELKDLEARVNTAVQMKEEGDATRFKNLIMMYDNMKAKDAAKIFDRLDPKVLIEVSSQLNPRRMSDILAQMSPEAAERLTVELAARPKDKGNPADLPKIEGRPVAN
jgi:flagellar motility protein MotE (MotC chaperone)